MTKPTDSSAQAAALAPSLPPPDKLIGRTIDGRYVVEDVIGEGGMGLVYRARHTVLNKRIAIKVLRQDVSKDEEIIRRFRQEAQSATAIGNQHIIDIIDFGTLPDASTYFVMEFLDGRDLTHVVENEAPLSLAKVVHITKQLCRALGAAHEAGIIHRDLKPDNIYLVKRGDDSNFVKVLDFGIAKVGTSTTNKLTRQGQIFGTPHYMSPEQCAGSATDARTDVYALGVIMYEMATGTVPFNADNLMGILTKHMYEAPPPPSTIDLPESVDPELEAIILKCLVKDPAARYQSMGELHADLERLNAGMPPEAVMTGGDEFHPYPLSGQRRIGAPGSMVKRLALGIVILGVLTSITVLIWPKAAPPVPAAAPATPAAVTPAAIPVAPEVAVPAPATITISTTPSGASVYEGKVLLGDTSSPFVADKPKGDASTTLTLRLKGYEDNEVTFNAKSSNLSVSLTKTVTRSRRAKPRGDSDEGSNSEVIHPDGW